MSDIQPTIQQLRASGQPLHFETTAPLTAEERRVLNKSRIYQLGMYILFDAIATAFPFLPFEDAVWEYQVGASIGLFILITWLIAAVWLKMNRAYRTVPKNIVRGIVTDKARHSGKKEDHYELTIGDSVPHEVSAGKYHSFQIGDGAELHYWAGWGVHVLNVKRWVPD